MRLHRGTFCGVPKRRPESVLGCTHRGIGLREWPAGRDISVAVSAVEPQKCATTREPMAGSQTHV